MILKKLEDYTLQEIVYLSGEEFAKVCNEANVGTLKCTKVIIECKFTEMEKVKDLLIKEESTIEDKAKLGDTIKDISVALQKLEDCATIIVATIKDKSKPRK